MASLMEGSPGERLLAHCQVPAPTRAVMPFLFEPGKSMRQQPLSVEDPILAKGNSDTQNSYTESANLTYNLHGHEPFYVSEMAKLRKIQVMVIPTLALSHTCMLQSGTSIHDHFPLWLWVGHTFVLEMFIAFTSRRDAPL